MNDTSVYSWPFLNFKKIEHFFLVMELVSQHFISTLFYEFFLHFSWNLTSLISYYNDFNLKMFLLF